MKIDGEEEKCAKFACGIIPVILLLIYYLKDRNFSNSTIENSTRSHKITQQAFRVHSLLMLAFYACSLPRPSSPFSLHLLSNGELNNDECIRSTQNG